MRRRVLIQTAAFSADDVRRAYFADADADAGDVDVNEPKVLKQGTRINKSTGKTSTYKFWGNVEDAVGGAYGSAKGAIKGAARGGQGMLVKTANVAGKGIRGGGQFVAEQTDRLAGVIRRNPKAAGAILLGGTVLGAGGGAYALNQQRNRNR